MCEFWTGANVNEKAAFGGNNLEFSDLQNELVFGCNSAGGDCFQGFISNFQFFDSWLEDDFLKK